MNYKAKLNQIKMMIFDVDGVLTDGSLLLMPDGSMSRTMNTKDGYAMKTAIDQGIRIAIITGGKDESVRKRLAGLGIHDVYLNIHRKEEPYDELKLTYHLKDEEILYMGDDLPDLVVMKEVGVAACPKDAVPEIRTIADYVSPFEGGKGCVRDIIEQTLKVQGKWETNTQVKSV